MYIQSQADLSGWPKHFENCFNTSPSASQISSLWQWFDFSNPFEMSCTYSNAAHQIPGRVIHTAWRSLYSLKTSCSHVWCVSSKSRISLAQDTSRMTFILWSTEEVRWTDSEVTTVSFLCLERVSEGQMMMVKGWWAALLPVDFFAFCLVLAINWVLTWKS